LGYFGYLYVVIPKVTVFPILIFVGLEITSQSFQATPRRHYPAVALACVPALASLALLFIDKLLSEMAGKGLAFAQLGSDLQGELTTVRVLASGFVLTSLLWASALAALIDRKLVMASACFAIAALCALFGVIHSPLPGSPLFLPWQLDSAAQATPVNYGLGYLGMAITLLVWRAASRREDLSISPEEENRL
jgi:AGZA family xanthine/uracil permease-like MFS transporter